MSSNTVQLEELNPFYIMRNGNTKIIEKCTHLSKIVAINLNEAGRIHKIKEENSKAF